MLGVCLASMMDGVIRYGTGSLWLTIVLLFRWDSSGIFGKGGVGDMLGPALQFVIVHAGVTSLIVIALKHMGRAPAVDAAATTGSTPNSERGPLAASGPTWPPVDAPRSPRSVHFRGPASRRSRRWCRAVRVGGVAELDPPGEPEGSAGLVEGVEVDHGHAGGLHQAAVAEDRGGGPLGMMQTTGPAGRVPVRRHGRVVVDRRWSGAELRPPCG